MNYMGTVLSATSGGTSTAAAVMSGNKILAYVTLAITILTTLSNFALETYRKWRDRDEDKNKNEKETEQNGDGTERKNGDE